MKNILIIDENKDDRRKLSFILKSDYHVIETDSLIEAMYSIADRAEDIAVALISLDETGYSKIDMLRRITENRLYEHFPILIIANRDSEIEERCVSYGISDFIERPFRAAVVLQRVRNLESLYSYRFHLEEKIDDQTKTLRKQAEILKKKNQLLYQMNEKTIELLSDLVEMRNAESGMHVRRVKGFTKIIAEDVKENCPEYGLDEKSVKTITTASAMHDVGKIKVSDSVLLKPGKLTPEEYEQIKKHTVYGCDVLERSKNMWDESYYRLCCDICKYHHEKWDGKGYPEGLCGDEIPIAAQLVSLADCFDALTSERVYKKEYAPERAYDMIMEGECGAFNPKLKKSLERCRECLIDLAEKMKKENAECFS